MVNGHAFRLHADPVTMAAYGALLCGVMAGFGGGVAATLGLAMPAHIPSPPNAASEVCELQPFNPDGIGFLILLDEASRRGARAQA